MNVSLARAIAFYRLGMNVSGVISMKAFLDENEIDQRCGTEIQLALHRGDWLRVADVLEYEVAPRYSTVVP